LGDAVIDLWSTITTLALGGAGWLVTSFVGRPFMQFHDLRNDVIRKSVLYANVRASKKASRDDQVLHVQLDNAERDRLREAQDAFRDPAARMRAFALNEPFAMRLVKWRGYDPMKASSALLGVSNTIATYGSDRAAAADTLQQVLRFRTTE
jgi:hypothetical protein